MGPGHVAGPGLGAAAEEGRSKPLNTAHLRLLLIHFSSLHFSVFILFKSVCEKCEVSGIFIARLFKNGAHIRFVISK